MKIDKGTKCVVIGLGISGLSALKFLNGLGAEVAVSERREREQIDNVMLEELEKMGIKVEAGGHTIDFCQEADLIVPSPGVPLNLPVLTELRSKGKLIVGELALAAGRIQTPVIGVTGSNGKTTVTSLIGHLLETADHHVFVGGNIGTPLLDYLQGPQNARALVLELSSFQLEIAGDFRPNIALLLNISPDHIDRHGSLASYAAAKRLIFVNQGSKDIAIIGAEDPLVVQEKIYSAGTVLRFGLDPAFEAYVDTNGVSVRKGVFNNTTDEYYDLEGTRLESQVNRLNAAAAILASRSYGFQPETIQQKLAEFSPPPHRMALVTEIGGVKYVDDSKGTNIGAVAAALASCEDRVILIAGGRDKESDFSLLTESVMNHVRALVLIGEAADRIEASLGNVVPVFRATTMGDAVQKAAELAQRGDTVLLSPACASFDMFENYSHRGEVFQAAVQGLRKPSHNYC